MKLQPSTGSKSSNKIGVGCLILFALPFAGFGVFALCDGVAKFFQEQLKDGLFLSLFGLVFSAVGFGLIIGVLYGSKAQKRTDAIKSAHPDEPWLWREDWAAGRIKSSGKSTMISAWIIAGFWNIICWIIFFGFVSEHGNFKGPELFLLLFLAVGLGLLAWAILATLRWRRFGQSWFRLLNNTGVIGGQLSGAIETSVKIRAPDGFHIHLRCICRESDGRNTTERILWEDEKTILKDLLDDPRHTGIPVYFQIPADCTPSDDMSVRDKIVWRLEVRAKLPGPDYVAQFVVPVFKTAASATAPSQVTDPTLAYQPPGESRQLPPGSRIVMRPAREGGTEFVFPAARNPGPTSFLAAFLAAWTAAIWFMVVQGAPIFFPIIFGLFETIFLLFLLNALLKSSRIVVDAAGIAVHTDWKIFRSNKRYTTDQIAELNIKIGMTSGNRVYYNLVLISKNSDDTFAAAKEKFQQTGVRPNLKFSIGSPGGFTLATGIPNKQEAEWLASEMRRLLKLDKPAPQDNVQA